MSQQPEAGWLNIIRYFDEALRPELAQHREVIYALQERGDDWEREQEHKRLEFEQRIDARLQFIGRNVEDLSVRLLSHLESQKLKDRSAADRAAAVQQEAVKGRWSFANTMVSALIGALTTILVALITGLLK